ncbi:MAG: hypothetical protein ACI9JN_000348 [Bacteroidia bacterium]
MNKWIWEKYKDSSLEIAKQKFNKSYLQVRAIIEQRSDAELFQKKRYKWTVTASLGAYLISATSSHYDWTLKLIKKVTK